VLKAVHDEPAGGAGGIVVCPPDPLAVLAAIEADEQRVRPRVEHGREATKKLGSRVSIEVANGRAEAHDALGVGAVLGELQPGEPIVICTWKFYR
jgi:hypothetical protein